MGFPDRPLGLTYRGAALWMRPWVMSMTVRHWSGEQHLPKPGTGFVATANHLSYFDPLIVAHYLYDHGHAPRFMAKQSVFDVPVVGRLIANTGQIPVPRGTADAALSLQAAVDAVQAGECVVIFPEATLTRDPDLWPMRGKSGAVRIGLQTGCPVVPIGQWGVQKLLPRYSTKVRPFPPKDIWVKAGPAVPLEDLREASTSGSATEQQQAAAIATDRLMQAITDLVASLRGEEAPPERFDPRAAGVAAYGRLPADT
jgi:1-acyl-sn-glycerol-3-phosphate acyltransferase